VDGRIDQCYAITSLSILIVIEPNVFDSFLKYMHLIESMLIQAIATAVFSSSGRRQVRRRPIVLPPWRRHDTPLERKMSTTSDGLTPKPPSAWTIHIITDAGKGRFFYHEIHGFRGGLASCLFGHNTKTEKKSLAETM
jgi:hypothetical protein